MKILSAFRRRRLARAERSARAELLRICAGDDERATRLLLSEQQRDPGISGLEACLRAIERYKADNR